MRVEGKEAVWKGDIAVAGRLQDSLDFPERVRRVRNICKNLVEDRDVKSVGLKGKPGPGKLGKGKAIILYRNLVFDICRDHVVGLRKMCSDMSTPGANVYHVVPRNGIYIQRRAKYGIYLGCLIIPVRCSGKTAHAYAPKRFIASQVATMSDSRWNNEIGRLSVVAWIWSEIGNPSSCKIPRMAAWRAGATG